MNGRTFLLVALLSSSAFAETKLTAAPGKGVTVTTTNPAFSLTLRGRIQVRDTVSGAKDVTNLFEIKTARIWLQGYALTPDLKYAMQLAFGPNDFEPNVPSPIFDAWIEWARWRDLQIRAGQFFVPFDRARTIREFGLQLVDRPVLVGELSLDRDIGITIGSTDLFGHGGKIAYTLGFFGGQGKNRVTPEKPGFLYTARVTFRPMGPFDDDVEGDLERSEKPHLAIGVAGAFNQETNRAKSTFGNTFTNARFHYAHAAADLVFKWHGFSLLAEALVRHRHNSPDFIDSPMSREWSRSGWGYLVQAGMMLTKHVEVAARFDDLHAFKNTDPDLLRNAGKEAGGGVNVYFNGHFLKLQTDYRALFDIYAPTVHAVRLQLDASF